MKRCVLTLASGKLLYYNLAAALARSFKCHHPEGDIDFVFVVDDTEKIPSDLRKWVKIVPLDKTRGGSGFELKLDLDRYSDYEQTLFIDADCLLVGPLHSLFDSLQGSQFTAFGRNETSGEWFGDIESRTIEAGVSSIPVFVGAVYYFENTGKARSVFEKARLFAPGYDAMGIVRLRERMNEEPLISLGMAAAGLMAKPDDGTAKCDVMGFEGPFQIDVLAGKAAFLRPRIDFFLAPQITGVGQPLIVHFNDSFSQMWEYRLEALSLKLHFLYGIPKTSARMFAVLRHESIGRPTRFLKGMLRPIYRSIFGVRKLKLNERV